MGWFELLYGGLWKSHLSWEILGANNRVHPELSADLVETVIFNTSLPQRRPAPTRHGSSQ